MVAVSAAEAAAFGGNEAGDIVKSQFLKKKPLNFVLWLKCKNIFQEGSAMLFY